MIDIPSEAFLHCQKMSTLRFLEQDLHNFRTATTYLSTLSSSGLNRILPSCFVLCASPPFPAWIHEWWRLGRQRIPYIVTQIMTTVWNRLSRPKSHHSWIFTGHTSKWPICKKAMGHFAHKRPNRSGPLRYGPRDRYQTRRSREYQNDWFIPITCMQASLELILGLITLG